MKNELVKLATDICLQKTGEFSTEEANETLRKALVELNGGSETLNYKAMRKNRTEMFELIEELVDSLIVEGLEDQFADFVDVRNVAFGDRNVFMVDDPSLFKVANVADGNGNIRRQRLDNSAFQIETSFRAVKIYEELERVLAGRVNFDKFISKIQRSFQAQIQADIYTALQAGYNALAAPYKFSGTFDRGQLNALVQHIEAATGKNAIVYGTKSALQQATPAYVSYSMMDARNNDGYFRVIDGIPMVEIKQAHVPGTNNFAVSDKFLLVIPQGEEKLVKLVFEGESIVEDSNTMGAATMGASRQVEYGVAKKYGVGVVAATRYGAFLLP